MEEIHWKIVLLPQVYHVADPSPAVPSHQHQI